MQRTKLKFTSGLFILGAALLLLVFSCKTEAAATTAQYTVTIELNGGKGISDLAPKVDDGDTLTLANPSKDGFVFKGWSTTNELSKLDFISGSTKVTSDIKIYAMYNTAFTVTIDPNGGTLSASKKSYQVEKGASLAKLDEIPQASQSYQTGVKEYRNIADGSVFTFGTSTVTDNITLKTVWKIDLKKVRDLLSGGSAASATGIKWTTSTDPTNNNIIFKFTSNDPNSLDLVYQCSDIGLTNSGTTTLSDSGDDYNAIIKFNPPINLTYPSANMESLTTTLLVLTYKDTAISATWNYTKQ